jgi:CrcB protein
MGEADDPDILPIDPDVERDPTHTRRVGALLRPDILAAIGVGGALGATARYLIERAIPAASGDFPWATFLINVSGSLAIGLFLVIAIERLHPHRYLRPFVATGFIGSFTTFSTFAIETDLLVKDGHVVTAALYTATTLIVGILCAWVGIVMGRLLIGIHADRRSRPR